MPAACKKSAARTASRIREQNDDGTYSQYGKKRVEGYEISVAGNESATSNEQWKAQVKADFQDGNLHSVGFFHANSHSLSG